MLIQVQAFELAAQGTFNAKNSGSFSPVLSQDGVTKLSKLFGRVEILYKGKLLSTAKNTFAADGIFSLGALTIPDVIPGGSAEITIRVWDSRGGATFAFAAASGYGVGASTFVVAGLGGPSAPPAPMDNFRGLTIGGSGFIITQARVLVDEDASGPVEWLLCGTQSFGGECEGYLGVSSASIARSTLGTFSGRDCAIIFHPFPHVYGWDYFQFPLCSERFIETQGGGIYIRPSPERSGPALVAEVRGAAKVVPKLRGLADHRYRVEKSTDLSAWELAGEVTGNNSEVDLSPLLVPDGRAQFFRATDLTPP